jgi:hypothetical protein
MWPRTRRQVVNASEMVIGQFVSTDTCKIKKERKKERKKEIKKDRKKDRKKYRKKEKSAKINQ